MNYDFAAIEKKWQANWEKTKPYAAITGDKRPKFYGLIEFPYPSGQGLHVGHPRPFTAMDIVTRKKRMQGYNVLFPIGFDAFGLPTENYAIKNHIHPAIVTKNNIENFTKQLKMLGYGFDWDRCVDTTDPKYYKWTQWIFLQMFKHGLAYKSTMPVNWCTSCKCVLANEEVVNGVCERCGSEVIRKEKSQWMLKITEYAQRLIDDLDDVDYIERVKIQQRNWIGRSTGAEITFDTNVGDQVTVYTTRADTLFGTTYMVISPEHPLLKKWQPLIKNWDAVAAYQEEAAHKSDFERGELNKEKTGVRLEGIEVMNPVTHKPLPMFVSDYVLMGYGTGIVMGVPGHDQRDWEFAKKFGLPIIEVVAGGDVTKEAFVAKDDSAVMVNSGFLNGMTVKEAIPAMKKYVVEQGFGKEKVNYKLRDWVFSRQRYWGEPIPIVYCEKCGYVPLPEDQLPLKLPMVDSYEPTETGESPLAKMTDWVNTTCPHCGGRHFEKETDTLDGWFDSGSTHFASMQKDQGFWPATVYLEGLDQYRGWFQSSLLTAVGALGKGAPFKECVTHGWTVDGEGKAMHKSLGNGVDPADIFNENGADILRLWAASADYHADVRCSKEIFKQLSQNYLKFRNTCKFMLDNLVDFDPENLVKPEEMPKLDRWLITKLNELIEKAEQSYCDYEFHIITHAVNDFCVNTLSSFYLDIVKDRLYCDGADSLSRRSAQTALYLTLHTLSKLFAPILVFTCDEIWLAMPHTAADDARNVVLNEMNKPFTAYALTAEEMANWEKLAEVRTVVNGVLEAARAEKKIGKSLEADVHLTVPAEDAFLANMDGKELADLLIVSQVEVAVGEGVKASTEEAAGTKCPRCWKHSTAANAEGLCPRCAEVMAKFPDLA